MSEFGISGRIARSFLRSKLTPLIVMASLLLGLFAISITPREEEPQIVVPMIDVMVSYPGASAQEVEELVTRPMEKLLWEIPGVEYIYSIVQPGSNLTIVRFYVGEKTEDSLVRLYTKLMSNYDRIPPGVSQPLVKARSIDDVPVLALTLWSESDRYTGFELRRVAAELANELKKDKDVSEVQIIGGQRRQVRVTLDPARLRAYSLSALQIAQALDKANIVQAAGAFSSGNREFVVEVGGFLASAEEIGNVVVGVSAGRPVFLRDTADIRDGAEEPANYVFFGAGPSAATNGIHTNRQDLREAVTISLAKKKGSNATEIADTALRKVAALRGGILPSEVQTAVTRNYGETAKDKSDELLNHMMIATVSIVIMIAFVLGWREAVVVAVAVPVTLALTLLINYLYGYTLNRVTLFALIFSIGILVDDAIVVVENIHRHFAEKGVSPDTAAGAVDEVGNPTILATIAVIAALLPMAFVSGLMGPYMRPIPVGASAAMIFSLLVAFIVSPWLGYIVLKNVVRHEGPVPNERSGFLYRYEQLLSLLIDQRRRRMIAIGATLGLLVLSILLVPFKAVMVKMLPFDNKSELEVIVDMPKGTPLEQTAAAAMALGRYLKTAPEVSDYEIYVGAAAPYNFNGLVRHYFMRSGSHEAGLQVNLAPKGERKAQGHDIAKRLRPELKKIGDMFGAKLKVAEIPPGPPVLSTLVAEIYGPDQNRQREIAAQVKSVFEQTEGVVDIDWYVEADQKKIMFRVDRTKAALSGVTTESIARTLGISLGGGSAGLMHVARDKEPVEILLRLPPESRSSIESLRELTIPSQTGQLIPMGELGTVEESTADKTIYHKNLKPVTYVIGDVAGRDESPVYAILKMMPKIKELKLAEGYELAQYSSVQPWLEDKYVMKWDGEWHITYEVFRDMGIAFAAVLVLIYVLVVAWFRSFTVPLVIMAPIPLTLVGILPGHWVFGAFFTATSMIGFIALAGIIVRNSILLIEFAEAEQKAGSDLRTSIIRASTVRFRPIVLTAAAVVVGSFVMLFDPIFQGLAISMIFGAVGATALTLLIVPLLFYELMRGKATNYN
ncbi:MAG: efflux RND transporter permease subunit [Negativicutes bacterium]